MAVMPLWGWIGVAYGLGMAIIAATGYARRRSWAAIASVLFALITAVVAQIDDIRAQAILPAAMTLIGYWLSGMFVGTPQPWLEQWLLESDHRLFNRYRLDTALEAAPGWVLNAVEFIYSTVYVVVVAGALILVPLGPEAVLDYWAVVFPAELVCCAALPFLRSRPPRSLEAPGVIARRRPAIRQMNDLIVNRGSIRVNTIPSAHVASALAVSLAVGTYLPVAGSVLFVVAVLIAAAATLGRYHYFVDCVLGAAVAMMIWLAVGHAPL